MSQAKVDQYKKEKSHRKQDVARAKFGRHALHVLGYAIIIVVIGFIARGIYTHYENNRPMNTYYVDLSAMQDYISGLSDSAE